MALSDTWLRSNLGRKRSVALEKTDRDGLSVRVSPLGKITFQLRYRYNKKAARLDIGAYPGISLKQAREESQRLRAELDSGHDPRIVRKLERKSIAEAKTLTGIFGEWYEKYAFVQKKGHLEMKRSFEIHVFPSIGQLPADKLTLHDWLDILEPLAKSTPGIADRVLTNAKQMLKWSIKRKLIKSNVLSDINAFEDLNIKKVKVARVLSDDEIKMLLLALEHTRMEQKNKLFIKLCLFYGCRNGELRESKKEHFDFDAMSWTIPAAYHKTGNKTGRPIIRPIIPEIEPLIKWAMALNNTDYMFTNTGTDEVMGPKAPLSLPYNIMQWLRRHQSYEMPHWSMHDLRRTARTNFSRLTEPHIAEIMLGHVMPGEWSVYDHYDYLEEQGKAYRKWLDKIMSLGIF